MPLMATLGVPVFLPSNQFYCQSSKTFFENFKLRPFCSRGKVFVGWAQTSLQVQDNINQRDS